MVKIFILLPLRTITYSFPVFMVKIVNKSVFISGFASKNISFVGQIFYENDARLNDGIILNQNTTVKANLNIFEFN